MPTYDYECRSCGHRIEVIHPMTDEGPTTCEVCGGSLRRVLHPTGIIFRGAGFYKTDSRAAASGASSSGAAEGGTKPATEPTAASRPSDTTPGGATAGAGETPTSPKTDRSAGDGSAA